MVLSASMVMGPVGFSHGAISVDKRAMGIIGSPIDTSLVQAAQAQQVAARNRDREKAAQDSAARRFQDIIELRVAGVEAAEALRKLPSNDSEQAESEHQSRDQYPSDDHDDAAGSRIDVQA